MKCDVFHDPITMNIRTSEIFIILSLLWILISWSFNFIFNQNQELIFQTFGNQLDYIRIEQMIGPYKKIIWIGYLLIPVYIFSRIFLTGLIIFIGIFFTELKTEFSKLFRIALIADSVYLLSAFAKLVILIFFKEVHTLEDLQFQPFSVMQLLDKSGVDPLLVYPLSLMNFFELGYFLILAWLLVPLINEANAERPVKFGKSLQLVTASYGSGLLLWVLTVMFITLNMS
jgi:hypothetical protein